MSAISTPITELFGIKHPILLAGALNGYPPDCDATWLLTILAGMNVAAGPELAAAVTNAGGLGVIGGVGYTPKILRQQVGIVHSGANGNIIFVTFTDQGPEKGPEGPKCPFWRRPPSASGWWQRAQNQCTSLGLGLVPSFNAKHT